MQQATKFPPFFFEAAVYTCMYLIVNVLPNYYIFSSQKVLVVVTIVNTEKKQHSRTEIHDTCSEMGKQQLGLHYLKFWPELVARRLCFVFFKQDIATTSDTFSQEIA